MSVKKKKKKEKKIIHTSSGPRHGPLFLIDLYVFPAGRSKAVLLSQFFFICASVFACVCGVCFVISHSFGSSGVLFLCVCFFFFFFFFFLFCFVFVFSLLAIIGRSRSLDSIRTGIAIKVTTND